MTKIGHFRVTGSQAYAVNDYTLPSKYCTYRYVPGRFRSAMTTDN